MDNDASGHARWSGNPFGARADIFGRDRNRIRGTKPVLRANDEHTIKLKRWGDIGHFRSKGTFLSRRRKSDDPY